MIALYIKNQNNETTFYGWFENKAKAKLIGKMMIRTGRAIKWSFKP